MVTGVWISDCKNKVSWQHFLHKFQTFSVLQAFTSLHKKRALKGDCTFDIFVGSAKCKFADYNRHQAGWEWAILIKIKCLSLTHPATCERQAGFYFIFFSIWQCFALHSVVKSYLTAMQTFALTFACYTHTATHELHTDSLICKCLS